jgi:hypothetical protein
MATIKEIRIREVDGGFVVSAGRCKYEYKTVDELFAALLRKYEFRSVEGFGKYYGKVAIKRGK